MKQRILALFLCTALVVSAGCGKTVAESLNDSADQVTENSDTADNEDATDTAYSEDTTNIADATDETDTTDELSSQLYSVVSERHTESVLSENDEILLMSSEYDTIEIQGDGYDALKTAVTEWQQSNHDSLQNYIADYTDCAREDAVGNSEFYGYSLSQTYQVTRSDNHVLSLLEHYDEYTGGAHPSYYESGINIDVSTGEPLTLENIALDSAQFTQQAISYVLDYLKDSDIGQDGGFYENYESMVEENFSGVSWYFTAAGITLVYNPYDIAPYAAGTIEITLPAADFEPLLKEEYRLNTSTGYAYIPLAETITFSSDASGETHTLMISNETVANEDGYEDNIPYVTLDDTKTPVAEWSSWIQNCYLIQQASGRILLAFENSFMSDDYETIFYDITNGTLEKFDSIYAAIYTPGTETITLNSYLYVLGTYSGYITYDISGSDGIKPVESEYIIPSVYNGLTTIKELPVTNAGGEEVLLPVGTTLHPVATDNESYMRVKDISTEEEYTIHFTRDDYMIIIDGIDEYQYFESIPYAG